VVGRQNTDNNITSDKELLEQVVEILMGNRLYYEADFVLDAAAQNENVQSS